jgi:hypothetical protein
VNDWQQLVATIAAAVGALAALATVFLAWRALVAGGDTLAIARDTLNEAKQERDLHRLERVREAVGELERLNRFGGDTARRERVQDRLAALLPSLGGHRQLPKTMALAHWNPNLQGAEDLLDDARLEVDAAIKKRLNLTRERGSRLRNVRRFSRAGARSPSQGCATIGASRLFGSEWRRVATS